MLALPHKNLKEIIRGHTVKQGKVFKKNLARLNQISMPLHKKSSFPLRISSINVAKSAVSSGFGHIYWRNP